MTTILIVDDSEIDRMVLKNILVSSYNVIEADNGYAALEILNNPSLHIDGLMLDISMPGLDGFSVLNLLDKSKNEGLQVVLISAEAQKNNIIKAANYGTAGFIKKPYDSSLVLNKLKSIFARKEASQAMAMYSSSNGISPNELKATAQYVEKLRKIYLAYLKSEKKNDDMYIRVSEVVHILLEAYYTIKSPRDLNPETIEIISQASYFYDIGKMIVRQEKTKIYSQSEIEEIPETHTIAGANLIECNSSPSVAYFVKICSDICMHHHERFDGRGMPHGLKDSINNVYTQICSLSILFCIHFFDPNTTQDYVSFNSAIGKIFDDKDAFRPDLVELLQNCADDIVQFFNKHR